MRDNKPIMIAPQPITTFQNVPMRAALLNFFGSSMDIYLTRICGLPTEPNPMDKPLIIEIIDPKARMFRSG